MNAEPSACASSDEAQCWNQLDWSRHERHVRRLQARIVKATGEGRWGKVKSLQRLLTHSFSGRALAVKRVTEKTVRLTGSACAELHNGLSRMRGNNHVRFLGEGTAATPSPYPPRRKEEQ